MKVSVVIPWRSHPSRVEAFEKLSSFFITHHPNFKLIISDSEGDSFNVSNARNLGAKKAIDLGADIIIFNDADFFAEPKSLVDAVKIAYELQEVVLPYNLYVEHLEKKQTDIFFKDLDFSNVLGFYVSPPKVLENGLPDKLTPCSGAVVMPTKVFQEVGGYEERISSWGPEDQLFHRLYFDRYQKLFTYVPGTGHSTYNDPTVRHNNPEHQEFFEIVYFKDKT